MPRKEWKLDGLEIAVFHGDGRGYVWVGRGPPTDAEGGDLVLASGRDQLDRVIQILQEAREHLHG